MSLFFPSEPDLSEEDPHLEDLANERLTILRRRARDADSMKETGLPYYDQTDDTLPCKPNTP